MLTVSRMGFNPVTATRAKQTAPVQFGVSSRFRDVVPRFELNGRATSMPLVNELRKNASGDPLVRIISDKKLLDAFTALIGFKVPVDFKNEGVLLISKETGNKIERDYMNTDVTDPTNTLNVKLTSRPSGVHTSLVTFSYYLAVVPKDRLTPQPKVTF